MPDWIEVSLSVDGESAEAVAEVMQRFGHQGVSIEQDGIPPDKWDEDEVQPAQSLTLRAYFPDDERVEDTREQLEAALGHMSLMYPMPTPVYQRVREEDWAEAWKVHYKPVRVGEHLLIRPRWIETEAEPGDIVVALDPGMAFGTGMHPTTQLCLRALENFVEPGCNLLDLGCGSGILAIAGGKLGAADILAVDIDPNAVRITVENAEYNEVPMSTSTGSLREVLATGRQFDRVLVNILAKIIVPMCDEGLGQTVRPGGKALFSGLIVEQTEEVEAALERTGLVPVRRQQQGDWVLIEAERPQDIANQGNRI